MCLFGLHSYRLVRFDSMVSCYNYHPPSPPIAFCNKRPSHYTQAMQNALRYTNSDYYSCKSKWNPSNLIQVIMTKKCPKYVVKVEQKKIALHATHSICISAYVWFYTMNFFPITYRRCLSVCKCVHGQVCVWAIKPTSACLNRSHELTY